MAKNNFWEYEYESSLDDPAAIPQKMQQEAYQTWNQNQNKQNMSKAQKTFSKLVNSEVGRYSGTLDRNTLRAYAKKYVADAIRSYKPETGNLLSTHIVNNLQRLHRLNYRNVQGLRAPENIQSKMREYTTTYGLLQDELGRNPTEKEVAKSMGVDQAFLNKMRENLKFEQAGSDTADSPAGAYTFEDKEENVIDLIHHDLSDAHKFILEHKTGYLGKPILQNQEIARRLNISPVRVTQISKAIGDKLRTHLGQK